MSFIVEGNFSSPASLVEGGKGAGGGLGIQPQRRLRIKDKGLRPINFSMKFRAETNFSSPASLAEGGGGKGAGGGLGIQPQRGKLCDRVFSLRLEAECTILPPYLDVHWTSLHPSFSRQVGINEERRGSLQRRSR